MAHDGVHAGTSPRRLRDLILRTEYNTEEHQIVRELYAPCFGVSSRYDRAVGYFRANVYRELGEPLLDFVERGGRVRIVCSPDIPLADEEAARAGYEGRASSHSIDAASSLVPVMQQMSESKSEASCLEMLRLLIEMNSLDLFVAIRPGGIYHRKIGRFTDTEQDLVVFSGSGNETSRAISSVKDWSNDEEFDVFRSWGAEFEQRKARSKSAYLDRLFAGGTARTRVRALNDVERTFLAQFRALNSLEDCRSEARKREVGVPTASGRRQGPPLYLYQRAAVAAWANAGRRGILSMATGTGKTITALAAIEETLMAGHPTLFLVPTVELLEQWVEEFHKAFPDVPLLLAGGGHDWRANAEKSSFVRPVNKPRAVIATYQTAATPDFLEFVRQADRMALVADEVHRLGSPRNRAILALGFGPRLGLSATPERLFDMDGSAALENFFGALPVYDLPLGARVRLSEADEAEVPILGHFLSAYDYDFLAVKLERDEQERWEKLTAEIRKLIARDPGQIQGGLAAISNPRLSLFLFQRAKIVKEAFAKVAAAREVMSKRYGRDGHWIVYCDNLHQLDAVARSLRQGLPHAEILRYHSGMTKEQRKSTLAYFEGNPSIVVAIKCLDEGVDVPGADGALILASSRNPREYIQRRGRILRKSRGKTHSTIVDVIVLPADGETEGGMPLSIVRGELARAYAFAGHAKNPEVLHRLWRVCQDFGVDIDKDERIGTEDDEEV